MKPSLVSRHARLLALCGLSAAVHLALLQWVAAQRAPHAVADAGAAGPLVVRLAPAAASDAAASTPPDGRLAAAAAHDPVEPDGATPARSAPETGAAPASAPTAGARTPAAVLTTPASTPAPPATVANQTSATDAAASPAALAAPAAPPAQSGPASPGVRDPAPGEAAPPPIARVARRYRTDVPKARRLAYAIVPDGAALHPDAAPDAFLDWRPDGDRYTLELDGVLGRLSSSGIIGDDGLAPTRATARRGERELATRFEDEGRRIVRDDGTPAPGAPGTLDPASALLRLAGIGLGAAAQLRGAIAVPVADGNGVRVDSYEVIGREDVVTGRGRVPAWHLAQRAAPGQPRLELWLAPDYDWLPVRLRLVGPDGGGPAQVLLRADP